MTPTRVRPRPIATRTRAIAVAVVVAGAACSEQGALVQLVPVATGSACGHPSDATALTITAYSDLQGPIVRAVGIGDTVSLAGLPDDTLAISASVAGGSGTVEAIGKTAPFDFDALADGATLPIFMAPPDAACAVGPLLAARTQPLVALAADGALIAGGFGADGAPLSTAERYDPATATFEPVTIPDALQDPDNGLVGGVLTPLPDGRVALTGTARGVLAIYDPVEHAFLTPQLIDRRVLHAAIAVDAEHLLVAGGCTSVGSDGACDGPLATTVVYDVSDLSHVAAATLASGVTHARGQLFDLGPRIADGAELYALATGAPEPGHLETFALADATTTAIAAGPAQVAPLDGGALLAAFAADGSAASGASQIIAPGSDAGAATASAPAASDVRVQALQDGRVLAVGGGQMSLFDPSLGAWRATGSGDPDGATGDAVDTTATPTLLRLADGSVLIIADPAAAGAPSRAWIFRHSIVGPEDGSLVAVPGDATGVPLTAPDPTTVTRSADELTLTAPTPAQGSDPLPARVLVGGPRMISGSLQALARVDSGGVALIAQQLGPGRALVATLVPGTPAQVARLDAAHASPVACTGATVPPLAGQSLTLELEVTDGTAIVIVDGTPLATCSLAADPDADDRGAWGLAPAQPGSQVSVASVTVQR